MIRRIKIKKNVAKNVEDLRKYYSRKVPLYSINLLSLHLHELGSFSKLHKHSSINHFSMKIR